MKKIRVIIFVCLLSIWIIGCSNSKEVNCAIEGIWEIDDSMRDVSFDGIIFQSFELEPVNSDLSYINNAYDGSIYRNGRYTIFGNKTISISFSDLTTLNVQIVDRSEESMIWQYDDGTTVTYNRITENQTDILADDADYDYSEDDLYSDTIADEIDWSNIHFIGLENDGTYWLKEDDDFDTSVEYLIHGGKDGVYSRTILYERLYYVSSEGILLCYGEDDSSGLTTYKLFDAETLNFVQDKYLGDYDNVVDYFEIDGHTVFVAKKTVDTFEKKYDCVKWVDNSGEVICEIALDESDYCKFYYMGDGIYKLARSWSDSTIFVDINRNSAYALDITNATPSGYCSDGEYIIYDSMIYDINNNEYISDDFIADNKSCHVEHKLQKGMFLYASNFDRYIVNFEKGQSIGLNDLASDVEDVGIFHDGVAWIEFLNGYISLINMEGTLLMEPTKCNKVCCEDDMYIVFENEEGMAYVLDRNGNIEELGITASNDMDIVYLDEEKYVIDYRQNYEVTYTEF